MRHAVLVMAYGDTYVLEACLKLLDDPDFDFYIHMDAKSGGDYAYLVRCCCSSRVVLLPDRIPVYWADYSQIEAELRLLKAAILRGYDYYHLISGADLPLKIPAEFNAFFYDEKNREKEFIRKFYHGEKQEHYAARIRWRYPFVRKIRRTANAKLNLLKKFMYISVARLPKKRKEDLTRNTTLHLFAGENWFSITRGFAKRIVAQEAFIRQYFRDGYTADELFMLTLLMNDLEYAKNQSDFVTRKTDWQRGKPYVWQITDKDELMASTALFARKFSESNDKGIVDELYQALMQKKECAKVKSTR